MIIFDGAAENMEIRNTVRELQNVLLLKLLKNAFATHGSIVCYLSGFPKKVFPDFAFPKYFPTFGWKSKTA